MNRQAAFTFFRRLLFTSCSSAFRYTSQTRFFTRISMTTATIGICFSWPFSWHQPPSLDEQSREHLYTSNQLIIQKRFPQADVELHALLKLLADAASSNQLTVEEYAGRRARVFVELAKLRLLMGDAEGAEGLLIQTMRDAVAGGVLPKDALMVDLSLKLALIYVKLGQLEKAVSGFDFCVTTQKARVDNSAEDEEETRLNNLALLGLVYNLYSHFLITQGQLKAGKAMLELALEMAYAVYPAEHLNCLHLLIDLANVASSLGEVESARMRFREAACLAKKNRNDVRTFLYVQWAVLEGNEGNFESADNYLAEALKSCLRITEAKDRERAREQIQIVAEMIVKWKTDSEIHENDIISYVNT